MNHLISRLTIIGAILFAVETFTVPSQALAPTTSPCQPSGLNPDPNNTAIIQTLCQGAVHCAPISINSYYQATYNGVQLCSQTPGTVQDVDGFWNNRCGSYVAWMVSQEQEQMPNFAQVGMPGSWPETIPEYFPSAKIVTNPEPGDIAVRPTITVNGQPILINGQPDAGHAMYILKSNWQNKHYLEVNAYNYGGNGDFSQQVWNPLGGTLTVNQQQYTFHLVFFRFPHISPATPN